MTSYKSAKQALDAAMNVSTSRDELVELARYDFAPVKKAVINHPQCDEEIIRLCFPDHIKSEQDYELVCTIFIRPNIPHDLLARIELHLENAEMSPGLYQLALEYYSQENVSLENIKKFVIDRKANSKFRNDLWKRTNCIKVRKLLDSIKQQNRIKAEVTQSQQPSKPQLPVPEVLPQSDSRLIGSWTWTDASLPSGYGLMASVSVHETYVFLDGGQFFRRVNSFASSNHGGLQQAFANTQPEDRGRWTTKLSVLVLNWDDSMISEIQYRIYSDTLELKFSKGPRYYLRN